MFHLISKIANLSVSYCIQLLHLLPKALLFICILPTLAFFEVYTHLKAKRYRKKEK